MASDIRNTGETYAQALARRKANSLKEQEQKFRKTGRVTKGIARAGLGVQAQDYVVRTNDNPWTIARSLLGVNAGESQVGALAQSILAANGGTFRPVIAGETLKIPGLSVPRGAAPSRYFMNNAGAGTPTTTATPTTTTTGTQSGLGQVAPITGLTAIAGAGAGLATPTPAGMPRVNYQPPTQGMPRVNFQAPNIQGALASAAANINPQTSLSRALQNRDATVAAMSAEQATLTTGKKTTGYTPGGEGTPVRDVGWNSRAAAWAFDSRVRAIRNQVAYADSIGNRQYLPVTMDGDNAAAIVATSPEYQAALTENGFTPDGQGLLEFYGYEFNPSTNTYVRLDTASSNGGSPLYDTRVWMPTGVRFVRQRPSRGQTSGGARYTTSGRGNVDYQGGYGSGGLVDWSIGF